MKITKTLFILALTAVFLLVSTVDVAAYYTQPIGPVINRQYGYTYSYRGLYGTAGGLGGAYVAGSYVSPSTLSYGYGPQYGLYAPVRGSYTYTSGYTPRYGKYAGGYTGFNFNTQRYTPRYGGVTNYGYSSQFYNGVDDLKYGYAY